MLLTMLKISPVRGKEQELIDILHSVRGPTLAVSGCVECSIFEENDEEHAIVFLEKWRTKEEMITHIRSPLYTRVLEALDLADRQPGIWFYEIACIQGMELIESARSV